MYLLGSGDQFGEGPPNAFSLQTYTSLSLSKSKYSFGWLDKVIVSPVRLYLSPEIELHMCEWIKNGTAHQY